MDDLQINMPTADWLCRYGLDKLNLTIYDVLAPTAVKRLSQHVAILNKIVFAKVCVCVLQQFNGFSPFHPL